jgi:NADH-quinone oxidoreductase subunit A
LAEGPAGPDAFESPLLLGYHAHPNAPRPVSPMPHLLAVQAIFAVVNIVASQLIGPKRQEAVKGMPYESGMNPIGGARRRFNVRFYILAMTFLVFDVEIIFLYPWAVTFTQLGPRSPEGLLFLGRILFFIAMSVAAYVYAWKKGVFRWD